LFCRFDRLTTVFADGGYTGTLIDWAKQMFGYAVKIVKRNEQHLFRVLPKRWIVERTFAWLNWSRRLPSDACEPSTPLEGAPNPLPSRSTHSRSRMPPRRL
jgi:transposase